MEVKIASSWKDRLSSEFEQEYFKKLVAFVKEEYATQTIYPAGKNIFNAFDKCSFEDTKVVILGQDPYIKAGQAHGLSFSVSDGVPPPPSLINIFKEIHTDLGLPISKSGNLERWASQGVLLLNSILTVRAGESASHKGKGWEKFTDAVIQKINDEKEGIVFLLWGSPAQEKGKRIDREKHYVLTAKHPSPMAANYGGWFGCKHFSQTNAYLRAKNLKEIDWS